MDSRRRDRTNGGETLYEALMDSGGGGSGARTFCDGIDSGGHDAFLIYGYPKC